MKTFLCLLFTWIGVSLPMLVCGQSATTSQSRYLALDVYGLTGFNRLRYLEGDEIQFKANGERYRAPLASVTDSTFDILVRNEIMDRTEPYTIRFADVDRVYKRKRIPFLTELGFVLPIAGVTYAVADFVNPRSLDGRTGRFRFDPQTLWPSGSMIVAGAIFYKLSHPSYRVGKKNKLRAF